MAQVDVISPEDEAYPKDRLAAWSSTLPALYMFGYLKLLRLPLTALFCSRKCPGDAILKAYNLARELRSKETPMISGFHTPVEKDMLDILPKGNGPVVICPIRELEGMRIPKIWEQNIQKGWLVLVSAFDSSSHRVIDKTAYKRNLEAAVLASEYVFVHVESGGETEKLARLISERVL